MSETYLPVELCYEDNDDWSLAPAWCDYFSMLGASASCASETNRIVAAVALPTRAYVAAFVAVGVVTSAAAAELFETAERHFQEIIALRPRSSVFFREKKNERVRRLKGHYLGRDEQGRARIQVEKNGRIHLVTRERANEVELIKDSPNNKLPKRQIGKRVNLNASFIERFFSSGDVASNAFNSSVFCAIVGVRNTLEQEITTTRFTVERKSESSTTARGTLQDILKVRAFAGENAPFFSDVFPSSIPPDSDLHSPRVVVLDGSNAYLRHQYSWPHANLVVLLDRTETAFEDAAHALNANYIESDTRNDGILDPDTFPAAPPSVETVFYEERVR